MSNGVDKTNGNNNVLQTNTQNNTTTLPKKFLFVSFESLSGDLAWQIKKEGHEVRAYVAREEDKDVYDGFLEKVDKWEEHKDWADVIVLDDIGFGEIADGLRAEGKFVVGYIGTHGMAQSLKNIIDIAKLMTSSFFITGLTFGFLE